MTHKNAVVYAATCVAVGFAFGAIVGGNFGRNSTKTGASVPRSEQPNNGPIDSFDAARLSIEVLRTSGDSRFDHDISVRFDEEDKQWRVLVSDRPGRPEGDTTIVFDQNGNRIKQR